MGGVNDHLLILKLSQVIFPLSLDLKFKAAPDGHRWTDGPQDIVDLRKFTADEFSHIHEVLNGICKFLVAIPGEHGIAWYCMAPHGSADMLPCNAIVDVYFHGFLDLYIFILYM